jgi:hypothetical protein
VNGGGDTSEEDEEVNRPDRGAGIDSDDDLVRRSGADLEEYGGNDEVEGTGDSEEGWAESGVDIVDLLRVNDESHLLLSVQSQQHTRETQWDDSPSPLLESDFSFPPYGATLSLALFKGAPCSGSATTVDTLEMGNFLLESEDDLQGGL